MICDCLWFSVSDQDRKVMPYWLVSRIVFGIESSLSGWECGMGERHTSTHMHRQSNALPTLSIDFEKGTTAEGGDTMSYVLVP